MRKEAADYLRTPCKKMGFLFFEIKPTALNEKIVRMRAAGWKCFIHGVDSFIRLLLGRLIRDLVDQWLMLEECVDVT